MPIIALLLAIIVSLLWYFPVVKAQGENRVLGRKEYLLIALKYGFLFTCLLIILTEILWDAVVGRTALSGLA